MEKRVVLRNRQGKRIIGLWNIPQGITPPYPAVIICHGFKGRKNQIHLKTLAETIAKRGIAAFRFDFTNEVGESDGSIEHVSFTQKLKDLGAVIGYVAAQKFVDSARIGLAGHSQGGQAILQYTPTDKRIKVIASLAGPTYRGGGNTNLERMVKCQLPEAKKSGYFFMHSKRLHKTYRINIGFYYDMLSYNTPAQIRKIRVPALLIHGSTDETVPLIHARKAYRLLRHPKRLIIFDNVPHTWRQPRQYRPINSVVASWFEAYL